MITNQTCEDEGPLTLERSKTVDEEIDFLDRNDPKKTNKPFFAWTTEDSAAVDA